MGTKNWTSAAFAAAACAAALVGTPAQASDASIYVQIAPPAPRYEVVPVARHGQAWVPGHWEWRHRQYVWVPGYLVAARPGYYYAQPQWVRQGDRWGYHAGGWTRGGPPERLHGHPAGRRDRDRDGTPDRWDRDRDGDGVPNRHDMRPNNPYRN
jgi:hypothetical protein